MWIMKIQMTILANLFKNGHTFGSILCAPILHANTAWNLNSISEFCLFIRKNIAHIERRAILVGTDEEYVKSEYKQKKSFCLNANIYVINCE